ncbi:T9SS type A sorting domain-containing protein [Winogradskyella sp.]|uniref:T9SS type A sorting domain-containing protein n=1 Tax=Winogradskyella sp. TaxID=1883156 RepID=UPI002607AE97|nr:T9SS type A sorting domain-containing protein [Winogradskyella sp.]
MEKNYTFNPNLYKTLIFSALFLFGSFSGIGQGHQHPHNNIIDIDWDNEIYYPNPYAERSSVTAPYNLQQRISSGNACASFIVDYNNFTPQAEAAFQFAVDIWANLIASSVPIRVSATFAPLGTGVLGSAGPAGFTAVTGTGFPSNTAFPFALAESITGTEIMNGPNPSTDITATFNTNANFYFGLDANPPINQIDFVSVVLHELCHGLGFLGFGRIPTDATGNPDPNPPVNGLLRNNGFLSPWDTFIENGAQTAITTFADPSSALLSEFTSNDLFSNGPMSISQNGGIKPTMYAPSPFQVGSSYSHWDEATYPAGNPNSLMSPFVSFGEGIHDPGLMTLGFMEDMGWTLCQPLSTEEFALSNVRISPNPFTSDLEIRLADGLTDTFKIELFDVEGRKVFTHSKAANNGVVRITDLDQLGNAIYFMTITNENTSDSITKKLIKI